MGLSAVKIEHIGVKISDVARSIAFYTEVLGFTLRDRKMFGDIELIFVTLGDHEIELIAAPSGVPIGSGSLDHFALVVRDLDAAKKWVASAWPKAEFSPDFEPWEGQRCTFFRGPDDERIELFERRT